ncbi:MAG: hypothetical protein ACFB0B_18445 [Thermonemataceae bacterium]
MTFHTLIQFCGLAHIVLGLGSLAIPKLLDWSNAFKHTPLLIKQIFWTYAGYILFINLFFGVVSLLLTEEMLSGTGLAVALTLLISIYWIARLIIQFVYFDKSDLPEAFIYKFGEWALVILFVLFSVAYSYAFYLNLTIWRQQ